MAGAHQSRRPRSAFDDMRDALQAAGQSIRPRGSDAFMASCPLHTDHTPSLSVTWRESTQAGRGGAVLLHCFSCQAAAADIAAALGMRAGRPVRQSRPAVGPRAGAQRPRAAQRKLTRRTGTRGPLPARITISHDQADHVWRRVRVYTYTTVGGTPVQQVIRQECSCNGQPHKRFQQRYRDGRQWVYRKPEGFTPVLYRPTAMRTAAANRRRGYGSPKAKKTPTPSPRLGRLATTNAQGAASFPARTASAVPRPEGRHRRRPRPRRLPARDHLYQQLHAQRRPGRGPAARTGLRQGRRHRPRRGGPMASRRTVRRARRSQHLRPARPGPWRRRPAPATASTSRWPRRAPTRQARHRSRQCARGRAMARRGRPPTAHSAARHQNLQCHATSIHHRSLRLRLTPWPPYAAVSKTTTAAAPQRPQHTRMSPRPPQPTA